MRYSLYDITSSNARGAGGLNAPSASSGLDNLDQTIAISNTLTLSPQDGERDSRASSPTAISRRCSTDRVGPSVSIAGVASFGTLSGSPQRRLNKMFEVVGQPVAPARCACAARRAWTCSSTTTPSTFRARTAARTRSRRSPNFLSGSLQQRRLHPDLRRERRASDQPQCRVLCPGRVEGGLPSHPESRAALRPAVARDDRHRYQQRVAACSGSPGRRSIRATRSFAAAPGCSSTACRCARWPMRCCRRATPPISAAPADQHQPLADARRARRCFRTSWPSRCPRCTLVNLTTMNPNLQNAYSRQAQRRGRAAVRGSGHLQRGLPVRARPAVC